MAQVKATKVIGIEHLDEIEIDKIKDFIENDAEVNEKMISLGKLLGAKFSLSDKEINDEILKICKDRDNELISKISSFLNNVG